MPLKPAQLDKDGLVQFPTVLGGVRSPPSMSTASIPASSSSTAQRSHGSSSVK
jgi:hypothetical protein